MKTSTGHFFDARSRRPTDRTRTGVLLIALVAMVAVLSLSPATVTGNSAISVADAASVDRTAVLDFSAQRITSNNTTTTTTTVGPAPADEPVRRPGPAARVPDPRPGDLRVDTNADVLPVGYAAAPAAQIIRDISYGPDESHFFDLHLPDEASPPVIVFIHSGGWSGGNRSYVPEMVRRFLDLGYAIASVDYRLAPEHPFPAPIHDVKRAIRELKVIGADTGLIDGDRLVLYGTSAGGHLAAFVGATVDRFEPENLTPAQAAHDSRVAGIVVAVGPTDLVQLYGHPNAWARPMSGAHAGCEPCSVEQLEMPSIGNHLHRDLPPAYWAYGGLDPLIDAELQGRVMADAWAQAAGSEFSWLDLVEGSDHNLDETVVNQRLLEAFVDNAVAAAM